MVGYLQPLDEKFPIVGPDGKPTLYFIRWAQQKQIDIGESVDEGRALEIIKTFLTEHPLQAGSGIQLTPDGDLTNSPTISTKAQEILDQVTDERGSILFRGASSWEHLPPGTSGNVLQTNGASADPTWVPQSGGGGGGGLPWWFDPPKAADMTLSSFNPTMPIIADDPDIGLTFEYPGATGNGWRHALLPLPNFSADWSVTAKISLLPLNSGSIQMGVVLKSSTSGRFYNFGFDGTVGFELFRWTNMTTTNSRVTLVQPPTGMWTSKGWFKLQRSGANILFSISADGKLWTQVASLSATEWLTTGADQVGLGVWRSVNLQGYLSCDHFVMT